jgi:hypothetical protein
MKIKNFNALSCVQKDSLAARISFWEKKFTQEAIPDRYRLPLESVYISTSNEICVSKSFGIELLPNIDLAYQLTYQSFKKEKERKKAGKKTIPSPAIQLGIMSQETGLKNSIGDR